MLASVDVIGIALILVFVANGLLGFVVYLSKSKESHHKDMKLLNKRYFELALAINGWVLAMFLFRGAENNVQAEALARFLYAAFAFIPIAFFRFTVQFFGKRTVTVRYRIVQVLFAMGLAISVFPDLLITGAEVLLAKENAIFFGAIASVFYTLFVTTVIGLGYLYLIDHYRRSTEKNDRQQTLLVIIGTFVAAGIGFLTNLILPFFGVFDLNWVSQITVMIMVGMIAVAILKYKLFNLKLVLTQVLVFLIWIISLYQFLSAPREAANLALGAGSVIASVVVGVLLVRSVQQEIEERERAESLSKQLKKLNSELQEVDQMKTEFLSLASHQLRTPLTSIKGYASMILEGTYGKTTKKVREPIERIFTSSNILTKIIGDLLDVSKIEQGGLQYEMQTFSLASTVQSVVDEQVLSAKSKRIQLRLDMKQPGRYALKGDQVKLRQVFQNLIDNAIKYTDAGGKVTVELSKKRDGEQRKIRVAVIDNGRGIHPDTIGHLFKKFSRGQAGKKTNTGGSGLGLYLALQIVKAHAGKLWAKSEGEGKGSIFIAEFPQQY